MNRLLCLLLCLPVFAHATTIDNHALYFIKVDTSSVYAGNLCIDPDNAGKVWVVADEEGEGALWRFEPCDASVATDAYYIIHHATGDTLAFDVPTDDEPAVIQSDAPLCSWFDLFDDDDVELFPFLTVYEDDKFYLTLDEDGEVKISMESSTLVRMQFRIELPPPSPPPLPEVPFDTAVVYKIKYLSGWKAEKPYFFGVDFDGNETLLDTVYAHVPDGQYIVNRSNRHSLINRTLKAQQTDTIHYCLDCLDDDGKRIPYTYLYTNWDTIDVVEIKPITDVGFNPMDSYLGYKYFPPEERNEYGYYFSCFKPDSLDGRLLGIDDDNFVVLLPVPEGGDTAVFIIEEDFRTVTAVQGYDQIATLQKKTYRLRSARDPSMYLSQRGSGFPYYEMLEGDSHVANFHLKEDTVRGAYYLLYADPSSYYPSNYMVVVDPESKRLLCKQINTDDKTLFRVVLTQRPQGEPDPHDYLDKFPGGKDEGKGYYEFQIYDPDAKKTKSLTKNFFDYAALGLEGESMLRAGTYMPSDLILWMDTAIGFRTNVNKPSFYIVKDVDLASAGANRFNIKGYFLHVMDSTMLPSHDDYTVSIDGIEYNRLNFVNATRVATDALQLPSGRMITNNAINEYRFYFQVTDDEQATGQDAKYYLVTEANLGDGRRSDARGYLSVKNDTLYVGPREHALEVKISGTIVSNETIPRLPVELYPEVLIIGGKGQIDLLNAAGQTVIVYNIFGRRVAQRTLASDHETIPVAQGLHIVKFPAFTRKVIVQ